MTRLLLLLILCLLAAAGPVDAPVVRTPREDIRIAEEAAARQAWAEAAAALARARVDRNSADAVLAYDHAVAAYRAGDLQQAAKAFEEAMNTKDAALAAAAAYNLGNTTFQLSSEPGQQGGAEQLSDAAEWLNQALGHYRRAITHNPNDQEARANGELAWRRLQEVRQEQQSQQEQQQAQEQSDEQDQQQSGEQQQPGEQQQQQQQSGEQEQQEQQQSGEQQQQQSGEQEQQEQQQSGEQQQQQASPSGTPRGPGEMTRQEAERMLQAVRDRERQRRLDRQKRTETGAATTGRDW